jgi:hypothetical protein
LVCIGDRAQKGGVVMAVGDKTDDPVGERLMATGERPDALTLRVGDPRESAAEKAAGGGGGGVEDRALPCHEPPLVGP